MATIQDFFKAIRADLKSTSFFSNRYVQMVMIAVLLAVTSGGLYFGYTSYRSYRNKEAQKILSVCLEEYSRAINGATELWPTVEMNCQLGYEQNSSSDLAPYFLAIKVEALVHQGKKEAVQPLLDTMMNGLSVSSPLYHLYQTQKALIELDSDDANNAKKGLETIKSLAENKQNNSRDIALYYLGLYYWTHDQIADAREPWQELVQQFPMSPWTKPVSVKLLQVT